MNKGVHISNKSNLHRLAKVNRFAETVYHSNPNNPKKHFMDITNSEVLTFLKSLHDNQVEYMLVGGVATVFHGHVRTTQDLDLWIKATPENKRKLVKALEQENVPGASHYLNIPMVPGWSSVTIGEHGFEADFMDYMSHFKDEDFDTCYARAKKGEFNGVPITVIHINDLIAEKKATGRHKDLDDVENLEKIILQRGEDDSSK